MKGDTVTVIILFIAIIVITLWISHTSSIKSYSPATTPMGYAPFEGYQNIGYSNASTYATMDDQMNAQIINNAAAATTCTQLNGMNGLYCQPNEAVSQIDIYSQARGDMTCKHSSGYHNSKGGLCLDEKMFQLLQTRGMNATGGYGQIGTADA